MEYVFLAAFVASIWIYMSDRKGWNATFKRISTTVRANLEAGKPIQAIEPVKEHDDWDHQFKTIENPPSAALSPTLKHEIVKTWYARAGYPGEIRPHYRCKCGFSDWELDVQTAQWTSARHVNEQNAAEELLARNGGTRAW